MAVQEFKAAINIAAFPFSYARASQSVLVQQQDIAAHTPRSLYGSDATIDYNTIIPLFYENIMPTARGITTVGYIPQLVTALVTTDFDQLIVLRDSANNNVLFSPARGKNYVLAAGSTDWVSYSPFAFGATESLVTKAYVNGRTIVFYEHTKAIEWDPLIPDIVTRTLTLPSGYAVTDIRGCAGASNYLILFTDTEILWSTTTDILDFSTLVLGAGRQIPIDLKGKITCVLPISGGFLIYTTENVVAASFSNDTSRPFLFREVQNSAGLIGPEQATGDSNIGGHYVYAVAGLQSVNLQRADPLFPEATDFLSGPQYDKWDTVTKTLVSASFGVTIPPKLTYSGSRYLFISYGPNDDGQFQYVLVYDVVYQRWGKLKILHVDVSDVPVDSYATIYAYYELAYEYSGYSSTSYEDLGTPGAGLLIPRRNFGFLDRNGNINILSVGTGEFPGVAIFGHCQVLRDRYITIQQAELDGVISDLPMSISLLPSDTGVYREQAIPMTLAVSALTYARFDSRYTARNIDIAVEASMSLNSLILRTSIHGTR